MPIIDEFYVIGESGLCYYSKSREEEINQTLLAGFLSALNSFSQEITQEQMHSIMFHDRKFTISKVDELLFVACTGTKTKESNIQKELAEMQQIFLQHFSPTSLREIWDGDRSIFSELDPQFDKFFVGSAVKRMASLF